MIAARVVFAAMPKPSFWYKLHEQRRHKEEYGHKNPVWQFNAKDAGYEFARAHGVSAPTVLHHCDSPADVPWDDLPDEFTIKAVDGHSSQGVLPLVRSNGGYRDFLAAPDAETFTAAQITDLLTQNHESGQITQRLLVEELLKSPHDGTVVPDIKLFCFRGRVGLIRQMTRTRTHDGDKQRVTIRTRTFSPSGDDLGDVFINKQGEVEASLPAPLHLDLLVDAGERLSRVLPVPFVRLDFYERKSGIVFGEVTPQPGGEHHFRADLDLTLRQMWEAAEADMWSYYIPRESGVAAERQGTWRGRLHRLRHLISTG